MNFRQTQLFKLLKFLEKPVGIFIVYCKMVGTCFLLDLDKYFAAMQQGGGRGVTFPFGLTHQLGWLSPQGRGQYLDSRLDCLVGLGGGFKLGKKR